MDTVQSVTCPMCGNSFELAGGNHSTTVCHRSSSISSSLATHGLTHPPARPEELIAPAAED